MEQYEEFKKELAKWANERDIETEFPDNTSEIACLLYKSKVEVLLCEDQVSEEAGNSDLIEFRIGNEQEGFNHVANIRNIKQLERVLWQYHAKLLQGEKIKNG